MVRGLGKGRSEMMGGIWGSIKGEGWEACFPTMSPFSGGTKEQEDLEHTIRYRGTEGFYSIIRGTN